MAEQARRQGAKLLAVGIVWLAVARLLADWGAFALPAAVRRHLTLQSYGSLVLIVATTVGLLLTRAVTPTPLRSLGVVRPRAWSTIAAALLAPVVLALSAYLAFRIALPTLLEEIARGGRAAAQKNTGAFGRAIVSEHPAVTLTWAVILTPIAEELAFRGALWTGITRLTEPAEGPASVAWMRRGRLRKRLVAWVRGGGIATVVTAAVFAWMHADQPGGAGIVRVVQTAVLGVALGVTRHASGGLAAPMLLHAVFNALTIAKSRKWIVSEVWPPPLPIPWWWWQLAIAGGIAATVGACHRWRPSVVVEGSAFATSAKEPSPRWRADLIAQLEALPPWWGHVEGSPEVSVEAEGDGARTVVRCTYRPRSGFLWPAAWLGRATIADQLRRQLDQEE